VGNPAAQADLKLRRRCSGIQLSETGVARYPPERLRIRTNFIGLVRGASGGKSSMVNAVCDGSGLRKQQQGPILQSLQ